MSTIFSTIRQEINDFQYNPIYPVQGYSFNQYDTIKRIHLYENSQFASGLYGGDTSNPLNTSFLSTDDDDRVFYQISTSRRDAVKRYMDIDIADISFEEINPMSERPIALLHEDFRRFAEKNNFSKDLNDLNNDRTTYGSAVIKTVKGVPVTVDLRRFFLDPTVETIEKSRFATLKHMLTTNELRAKIKDGWDADAIERILRQHAEKSDAQESYENDGNMNSLISSQYIEVYERYGYVAEKELKGGTSDKEVMSLFIVAEPYEKNSVENTDGSFTSEEGGAILFKSRWHKEKPFRETHFMKTKGRWLGIGVFEILFTAQERMNELANQKRISMQISALHLFQTSDPTILNNLLNDLESGDLIQTKLDGAIKPVVNEERNLPAFNLEEEAYTRLADGLTGANDLVTGADVPKSTPATNVVVQNNNLLSIHLNNREEFANFVSEYVKDYTIPQLIKDVSAEHYVSIAADSEDIIGIDNTIVDLKMKTRMLEMDGNDIDFMLDPEGEREKIMQELKESGSKRYVKVFQDYYKEKLDDIIVHVDNEKKDIAKVANNTFQFYSLIASNPEAMSGAVNKLLLTNYARDIGVDTSKLEVAFAKDEAKLQQAQAQEQEAKSVPNIAPQAEEKIPEAKVL